MNSRKIIRRKTRFYIVTNFGSDKRRFYWIRYFAKSSIWSSLPGSSHVFDSNDSALATLIGLASR